MFVKPVVQWNTDDGGGQHSQNYLHPQIPDVFFYQSLFGGAEGPELEHKLFSIYKDLVKIL